MIELNKRFYEVILGKYDFYGIYHLRCGPTCGIFLLYCENILCITFSEIFRISWRVIGVEDRLGSIFIFNHKGNEHSFVTMQMVGVGKSIFIVFLCAQECMSQNVSCTCCDSALKKKFTSHTWYWVL